MSSTATRRRELKQDRPSTLARERKARQRERERSEVLAFPRVEWRELHIRVARMYRLLQTDALPWEQPDYQRAFDGMCEILGNLARVAPAIGAVMETQGYAPRLLDEPIE